MNSGIEIGGYVFYPSFWIAVVIVPVVITLVLVLIYNFKLKRKAKSFNSITSWQKERIVELIDKELEDMADTDEEYKEMLKNCQGYIRHKKFWNVDELLDIDEDAVVVITSIVYDEIVRDVRSKNNNDAVLLLHAVDYINGGCPLIGQEMEWIGTEIEELKNDLKMTDYEARLLKIFYNSIDYAINEVDIDINKIPEGYPCDPELKNYILLDFEKAQEEILDCIDMRNLSNETLTICARCLTDHMKDIIVDLSKKTIPDWQLYYIRAIACALDKQLYPDIVNSIDFN